MGRLIEESKVLEILHTTWLNGTVDHRIIDEIKQRIKLGAPTVEAIPKADYEARLKADLAAMLEDLDLQIDESAAYNLEVAKVQRLIRDRIDKLKEDEDDILKEKEQEFHCGVEESGFHAYNCNDCPNKCEEYYQWDKEMKK